MLLLLLLLFGDTLFICYLLLLLLYVVRLLPFTLFVPVYFAYVWLRTLVTLFTVCYVDSRFVLRVPTRLLIYATLRTQLRLDLLIHTV